MTQYNSVAIVGSRTIKSRRKVFAVLDYLFNEWKAKNIIVSSIVSGGALGVDTLARTYGKERNIPVFEHLPEWEKYGKSAGYKRNELIAEDADVIICFWNGVSSGCMHTVTFGRSLKNKFILVFKETKEGFELIEQTTTKEEVKNED
jgi:predicted Rossmann fold nucleotide-binding protein DprA/Smf involved in DNA uptake